jgi:hypothetical protein
MHGDTVVCLAKAGDKGDDFKVWVGAANEVEGKGAVLSPTPEKGRPTRQMHVVVPVS